MRGPLALERQAEKDIVIQNIEKSHGKGYCVDRLNLQVPFLRKSCYKVLVQEYKTQNSIKHLCRVIVIKLSRLMFYIK